MCVLKLSTFPSRLTQNNNMKSPQSARLRTETATANYFNFHSELNASFIRCAQVEVWRRRRR